MNIKNRSLKNKFLSKNEKIFALATWIRENEKYLRYVLEHNISEEKIQLEAMIDLGDKYPSNINFGTALYFSLLQLKDIKKAQVNYINIPIIEKVEDLEKIARIYAEEDNSYKGSIRRLL